MSTENEFFINGHPGILPDYRGLDPVLWSLIENGPLGATLHKIDQDVDSGIIFKKIITKKTFFHDIIDLRIYCINLCAKLVVEYLKNEIHMKSQIPILADYQVRGKFNMDDYGIVINKFEKGLKQNMSENKNKLAIFGGEKLLKTNCQYITQLERKKKMLF